MERHIIHLFYWSGLKFVLLAALGAPADNLNSEGIAMILVGLLVKSA